MIFLAPISLARTVQRISLQGDPGLLYFVNGAYYSVTGMKIHLEKGADILFMHALRNGSILLSDMEESNRSASMISMS
jgi:hypothetical protein